MKFAIKKSASSNPTFYLISDTMKSSDIDSKMLKEILAIDPTFEGKKSQFLCGFSVKNKAQVILVGIGKEKEFCELSQMKLGGKIADKANAMKLKTIDIVLNKKPEEISQIYLGIKLKNYVFDKYFVDKAKDHKVYLNTVNIVAKEDKGLKAAIEEAEVIANNVHLVRDLVSEPPNVLYPETFAKICSELKGLKVKVMGEKELKKLGMGALLGVAQGSVREPKVVIMEYSGDPKSKSKPIAFIGKGVTFDSGGINIKTMASISDMKYDMTGAAVVTGLLATLANRKAKVNAIGAIGLVENMPSGTAQRPSDVVVSMSGQTIEVDNTDAEGRLVLADVMHYVEKNYSPEVMIDLATLTGAIVVALGDGHAGLFSNDDKLAKELYEASVDTGELVWRMPLSSYYDQHVNSEIADVKNTGTGVGGGSITAAQFLQRFVKKASWAHLDIAGMAWNKKGTDISPKGATGYGVRMLNHFVKKYWEK